MLDAIWQRLSFAWGVIRIASYSAWRFFFPADEQQQRPTVSALVLGLQGVGKTTMLTRLANETPQQDIPPTKGFAIKAIQTPACIINAMEIGGNPKLRPYWHRYFHQAHGLVVVVSDKESTEEQAAMLKGLLYDKRIFGPRLIIANTFLATAPETPTAASSGGDKQASGPAAPSLADVVRAMVDAANASGQIKYPVSFRAAPLLPSPSPSPEKGQEEAEVRAAFGRFGAQVVDALMAEAGDADRIQPPSAQT
ncbi:hypothetical protein PTSG_00244 [Salpingoeca rosetta]|uniref:Uncharacterized protein n=1 Tax=Salpingoeca rosetta (strain ATCC 50818 / BSB-021) TaxID=946362 RepID=F2TVX7_SALR5|nr:uncharacterized protein PTSG_00244 [Salpingoeca rosetta]EGD72223.1 hypothetical protein PTSG_00244 [Salpingoeca rosetta]|eukprot:XP_004998794.1 hypothetical protein PTSG_00244 [Salpingoeca rosetta]